MSLHTAINAKLEKFIGQITGNPQTLLRALEQEPERSYNLFFFGAETPGEITEAPAFSKLSTLLASHGLTATPTMAEALGGIKLPALTVAR